MNEWLALPSLPKGPVTAGTPCALYGVPVEWVSSFPSFSPTTQKLFGNISLKEGKEWLVFTIAASGKEFQESSKTLNGLPYWEQQIQGNLYWQGSLQHVSISNMLNHRWIFIVKEGGTGLRYVVGSPKVGATVSANYTNKQGTVTGVTIAFRSPHRAPLYYGRINETMGFLIMGDGGYLVDAGGGRLALFSTVAETPAGDFSAADFTSDFVI